MLSVDGKLDGVVLGIIAGIAEQREIGVANANAALKALARKGSKEFRITITSFFLNWVADLLLNKAA